MKEHNNKQEFLSWMQERYNNLQANYASTSARAKEAPQGPEKDMLQSIAAGLLDQVTSMSQTISKFAEIYGV